jgi:hypothetical protein
VGEVNLPSIIPSYVYTLFASIIVSSILICACGLSTLNVRYEAERQRLSSVAEYVVTKSVELISHASADNLTSTLHLNVPSLIGNQIYWIQIANDSSKTWVEVGFGTSAQSSGHRAYIPSEVSASGLYVSDASDASLECYSNNTGVYLKLSGGN